MIRHKGIVYIDEAHLKRVKRKQLAQRIEAIWGIIALILSVLVIKWYVTQMWPERFTPQPEQAVYQACPQIQEQHCEYRVSPM